LFGLDTASNGTGAGGGVDPAVDRTGASPGGFGFGGPGPSDPATACDTDLAGRGADAEPRSDGAGSTGGRSFDPFFVSSLWGADGTPHVAHDTTNDATLAPGASTPTYHASTGSPQVDELRQDEDQRPRPSPSPRPLVVDAPPLPTAAVPEQRPSGPVDPVSGLRRRVPQSHLSAQLRAPESDTPAPVLHPPSTADAAAALSRYQASRAAAQARVGGSPPTDPATTTGNFADGGHE